MMESQAKIERKHVKVLTAVMSVTLLTLPKIEKSRNGQRGDHASLSAQFDLTSDLAEISKNACYDYTTSIRKRAK